MMSVEELVKMGKDAAAQAGREALRPYESIDAVNWSTLRELRKSPAHYAHALKVRRTDTPSMRLGRAVHVAVLEPEKFGRTHIVYDSIRRGKAWEAFKAEHQDKEILSESEFAMCFALQASVRRNPHAIKHLARGESEVPVLWKDAESGLDMKGRLDWVNGAILDLKTTRDASPSGFGREVWKYGYHCQLSLYQDGWAATHNGMVLPVVIVAVESAPPHVVTVFRMPDHVLEAGRAEVRELLDQLATLRKSNDWPGYSTEELQLELPRWAVEDGDSDQDVSGLGLEFHNEEALP